ncbi:MAG: transcriptional repressor [Nitrospina sp.]|jgi:Fur family ferric uptake transcriptional regulator|nr:transcriptional repressor [Nitrospina sp.]MBT6716052.1 transcriptional repressor [Nitrospina sp.]
MVNEFDIFKDFLRERNLRWTPQRKLILEIFLGQDGHIHIEDLHIIIKAQDPTIGIATLYRTMKLLVDSGLADIHTFNEKTTYERLFQVRHHDHLICKICGRTIEFEHPLIEKYQLEVCDRHGFTLKSHRMELFGICRECNKTQK